MSIIDSRTYAAMMPRRDAAAVVGSIKEPPPSNPISALDSVALRASKRLPPPPPTWGIGMPYGITQRP